MATVKSIVRAIYCVFFLVIVGIPFLAGFYANWILSPRFRKSVLDHFAEESGDKDHSCDGLTCKVCNPSGVVYIKGLRNTALKVATH